MLWLLLLQECSWFGGQSGVANGDLGNTGPIQVPVRGQQGPGAAWFCSDLAC